MVLDTFMGSGSTCVAAMRSGRRSIGIETTEKFHRIAQQRVEAVAVSVAEAA
jgi:adenine-specific DNA-methyltransferase